MAEDEDLDEDEESEGDGDEESQSKKGGKKTLFIVIGVVVLLILGAVGALLVGLPESATETTVEEEEGLDESLPVEEEAVAPPGLIFHELPEMLVDMNDVSRRTAFLRLKLTLALAEESDRARAEMLTPRIVDHMLAYLREVRAEEISGSAGMHRMREELLKRAAIAIAPAKVEDILFTEVLMQ